MAQSEGSSKRSSAAGGWGALKSCGKHLLGSRAPLSGARALLKANQPDGFDCPGCAWGDPEHGSSFEFCENGVKAVAWEATDKRTPPSFFARHTLTELRGWSDYALEGEGRLTHPMRYDAASDRYLPVSWDEAFAEIGATLRGLDHPDQAEFYTSGRASNEAAYLYQLFARAYGTNNFPDCSNMCHEASGVALIDGDRHRQGHGPAGGFREGGRDLLRRPESRHQPSAHARRPAPGGRARRAGRGAESGARARAGALRRSAEHRRDAARREPPDRQPLPPAALGRRHGGLPRASPRSCSPADAEALAAGRPSLLDRAFLEHHTAGLEAYRAAVEATTWEAILDQSGLTMDEIAAMADVYLGAQRVIATWAMGVTQHRHSVATIREIANLLFLRGHIGRPGAGLCPVRGHSNVQGDRTVGINERPAAAFLDALEQHFGLAMPRRHGHNVLAAIRRHAGRPRPRRSSGSAATSCARRPTRPVVAQALASCRLTVHIATKLNHAHLVPGAVGYLLPCLGRTEIDRNADGKVQIVTVEDSMSMVHGSGGINKPASKELRSEIAIIAGIAAATVGAAAIDWARLRRGLRPDPRGDRRHDPGLYRLQHPGAQAARLHAAQPRAPSGCSRPPRAGPTSPRMPCRPRPSTRPRTKDRRHVRAADVPQPRPVQHHDLRPG